MHYFGLMMEIALVTPTHKKDLKKLEFQRLKLSIHQNPDLPHFFVVPKDIDNSALADVFPNSQFIKLESNKFSSLTAYNRLLLSPEFYKLFIDFQSILILQTDAFLQRNILPILDLEADYIGAPWEKPFRVSTNKSAFHPNNNRHFLRSREKIQVGNGGLSFRRVQSMLHALEYGYKQEYGNDAMSGIHNEDLVISFLARKTDLKVPETKVASMIFTENNWNFNHELKLIYGFHALEKYKPELEIALINDIELI
jgi:hypothetical protein